MTAVTAINNLGSRAYNPRGNLWFNDESTYGRKLLMKMGWSKGKGLGKNEDGIKENLSVKFRSTNSGLGYKDDAYANVMKTEYESILKNLSDVYSQNEVCTAQKENTCERKSCEQRSRVIGSRLRYPKLFFGKDVSKYSEKDMKSIFICSQPSIDNQEILEDSIFPQKKESKSELPKVVETHSSTLSVSEYFAKKMKERKKNALSKEAFNDPGHQQPALDPEVGKTKILSAVSNKKSKRHEMNPEININQESVDNSYLQQTEAEAEVAGTADDLNLPKNKSSSKKRKKKTEINEVETDTAHAMDLHGECIVPNYKKRKLSEDNVSDISKKKRKSETYKNEDCSADVSDVVACNVNEDKISCQIELSSDVALHLKKKLKKYKNRNKSTEEGELSVKNSQVTNGDPPTRSEENTIHLTKNKKSKKMKIKKLKSCLKSKSGSYSIKNVSFNESVCYRVIGSDLESIDCLSDAYSLVQNNLTNEVFEAADEDKTRPSDNIVVDALDKDKSESSDNNGVVGAADKDKIESSDITSVRQEISSDDTTCIDSSVEVPGTISDAELKESCSLFSLPTRKSPHYNSWIEGQTQALKMDLYKNMLKSMKCHKVLKSSNLLSIKGYGNWGFK